MEIDRTVLVDMLRADGDQAKADRAARDLPATFSADEQREALERLGITDDFLLTLPGATPGGG